MAQRKQTLTPGEQDVLNLIERGNAVDQIAEAKGITPSGVYGYIRKLKQKGHLHKDQSIPTKGTPETVDWKEGFTGTPTAHVGENGHALTDTNGNGARYGYEIAFDTVLKSSTAEAQECDALAMTIKETEDMLAEMRDRLTLLEHRRDALRDAGKALKSELADTSQFAMAE